MASSADFVQFVLECFDDDCAVTARKMFGEYGLYSGGKFFGQVNEDRLYVKPTEGGRAHMGRVVEAEPYPGAKPALLIEDRIEDKEWLSELVRITCRELPDPKPRKARKKKPKA